MDALVPLVRAAILSAAGLAGTARPYIVAARYRNEFGSLRGAVATSVQTGFSGPVHIKQGF
jgi:hypothetical protein